MKLDKFELDKKTLRSRDEAGQSWLSEHNLRWKNSNFKCRLGLGFRRQSIRPGVLNHS